MKHPVVISQQINFLHYCLLRRVVTSDMFLGTVYEFFLSKQM